MVSLAPRITTSPQRQKDMLDSMTVDRARLTSHGSEHTAQSDRFRSGRMQYVILHYELYTIVYLTGARCTNAPLPLFTAAQSFLGSTPLRLKRVKLILLGRIVCNSKLKKNMSTQAARKTHLPYLVERVVRMLLELLVEGIVVLLRSHAGPLLLDTNHLLLFECLKSGFESSFRMPL